MERISVIKIGGKVIENAANLDSFLNSFSLGKGKKVLVHGGGKRIDQVSSRMGIKVKMVEGRRITGPDSLEIVQMVLAGLLNKNIVSRLQGFNCNAVGLTGADGNLVLAKKRPPRNGVDYGLVGDVIKVNTGFLEHLFQSEMVPVIASMTHDGEGRMLNTNADTIAAEVAISLSGKYETDLVYCFDRAGVLRDMNDESSLIKEITSGDYDGLKSEGSVSEGMIPKIDSAFAAIGRGVARVLIINALNIESYFSGKEITGTVIRQ
jgi:acetylglutamate kinase